MLTGDVPPLECGASNVFKLRDSNDAYSSLAAVMM
jgi:hypothetical protein